MVHCSDQKVKKDDRMSGQMELLKKSGRMKRDALSGNRVRHTEIFPECAGMRLGKQSPPRVKA